MFGFHFSPINQAMVSQNPSDSINLFWNQQMEFNKANSIMFMTPNFDASICWEYPQFGTYGNNLLNPMLAIQQTMQAFNNGSWGQFGNFGNTQFGNIFNNAFQTPWTTNNNTNNSNMTDAEKVQMKKKEREYNALKALITEYKNAAQATNSISPELVDEIQVALNNNGSCPKEADETEKALKPIDRKLRALKDLYKKLDKNQIRRTVSSLASKDNNFKEQLEKAGYNFGMKEYSFKNAKDTDLKSTLDNIHREIACISDKNENSTTEFNGLIELLSGKSDNDILRIVSYWNDKYGSKDDERSIIRFLAKNLNKNSDLVVKKSENLAKALMAKAEYVKDNSLIFDEKTLENLSTQSTNVNKALENLSKSKSKADMSKLADEFETLYVMLRRMEAKKINADINNSYKFLNDIASDDVDFINDDIIVKDTEADLKAEGLENVKTDIVVELNSSSSPRTVQEEVDELVKNGDLKKVKDGMTPSKEVPNCYQDKDGNYYTIKGDKLVKLEGIQSRCVYANGRCKGTDNKMHNISDMKSTEVEPSSIKTEPASNEEAADNTDTENEEAQTSDTAKVSGKVLRQKLYGDTTKAKYEIAEKKLDEFGKYTDAEDIVAFIEGYDEQENGWYQWNNHLCAQISTEHGDSFKPKREKYLKLIAKQILKVMDECGYSKDDDDYIAMKYYATKAGTDGNDWDEHNKWPSWLTWSSKRTNAATKMDEIIDDVIKKYRAKESE